MEKKNTTGKFIIIYFPDNNYDCNMERFDTLEELEKAVKENYTSSPVIACQEIEQKLVLEEDLT